MAEQVLVIGVGNIERGDDAAGLLVARRLVEIELPGVQVVEHDGEAARLMDLMEMGGSVFLVDTAVTSIPAAARIKAVAGSPDGHPNQLDAASESSPAGLPPGTVRRFDAHLGPLPADLATFSTHAFGAVQAVELARALGRLPQKLVVYAIEGADFGFGESPSQAVMQGVAEVVNRVQGEVSS